MIRRSTLWVVLLAGCATAPAETPVADAASGGEQAQPDGRQGATIYDKWWAALGIDFQPDDPATPAADGKGGPNGDGTLNDADGNAMLNGGHDYRLKNLFGWDLRGGDGIYGAAYHAKPYVLPVNLLAVAWTREQMTERLTAGGDGVPAYGQVLDAGQLAQVVEFVFDVREGRLPRPDQIWELSEGTPKSYRLRAGGDVARGAQVLSDQCASCHGADGRGFLIDERYSLGSHARQKSYEDWLKMIGGQPGTSMGGQLPPGDDGAAHAAWILDVLAALCDRQAFPTGDASAGDAADGDARCGGYLK
ncbi:MAG: hypothetical protein OXT09_16455 [Myxococcales bacterium]|nr:hypothetical protein [Myxococcales bacterium]